MYICFILSRLDEHAPRQSSHRISGQQWALDRVESEEGGYYYPHIASRADEGSYRFFAGRLAGVKPSSELPAEHPVCMGSADDWQFPSDEPGGSWIALKFDRRRDTLSIASDVFLLQRWYYLQSGGRWYFSNSLIFLRRVAEPTPVIEERSVPYMLLFNYLPNRYTPLSGVYSVRPGQTLTVQEGHGSVTRRVELPFERSNDSVFAGESEDAIRARVCDDALMVMREAVSAELRHADQVTIPLSGGMDSRFVLGCAMELMPADRIITYTYGRTTSCDFQIGTRLARELGLRNLPVPMDARPLTDVLADGFRTSEGMKLAIPNSPIGPQRDALPYGSHVLSGYLGDTMWGVEDIKRASDLIVAGDMGEHLFKLVWEKALTSPWSSVRKVLRTDAWDDFGYADTIRTLPGSTLEERYSRWFAEDRDTNRINFAIQVHRDRAYYLAPNVHSRVVRFTHGMPVWLRRGGVAYFAAMRAGFPKLYNYPTTRNFGYPPDRDVRWRRRVLRRVWNSISRIEEAVFRVTGNTFFYPPLGPQYAHPLEYQRKRHREIVLGCLESLLPMGILDPRGIRDLRDAYFHRKPHSSQLLKALITIQQWQEHYAAPGEAPGLFRKE